MRTRGGSTSGSSTTETSVLVVDDQRAFADAVALAVDSQRELRCVGAVGTAEEALAIVEERCPDVILLDVRLPGMSGLDAVAQLRDRCPSVRILVLTADDSRATFLGASAAGADGFLPKDAPFTGILEAVRGTDNLLVDPKVLAQIVRTEASPHRAQAPANDGVQLTERELEVLRLLAEGIAVKQIARYLGVSVYTCRGHVRSILHKLDVHSQLAAVVAGARLGLLHDLGR